MSNTNTQRSVGAPLGSKNGKKPPEKIFKRTQITVPSEVVEWLRVMGGGNVSKGIRELYKLHAIQQEEK